MNKFIKIIGFIGGSFMAIFVLYVSMMITTAANAGVVAKLGGDGNILAIKPTPSLCYVIDIRNIQSKFPRQWTSISTIIASGAGMTRDLTVEEMEVCFNRVQVEPMWTVAKSGSRITRPFYSLNADGTRSRKRGNVSIGESCDQSVGGYELLIRDNHAWKKITIEGNDYVAVCTFQ